MDLDEAIRDLRQRKRGVRPEELDRVLRQAGFAWRQGKGDHWVYRHPGRQRPLVIDPRRPLKPAYVELAIKAILEVAE